MDQDLISLLLVVICSCSDGHVKNPYLTAKFVEILYEMSLTNTGPSRLYDRVLSHPLSVSLPTSLMRFYTRECFACLYNIYTAYMGNNCRSHSCYFIVMFIAMITVANSA